ncbi:ATP-binding protein [Rhodococcus tukisamuensis]|uniref:histidine kinase n=1 Tax=Rhodococcus tukisamuensis TaxID=168276 RepID=A0A1G6QD75_9NOCA|nr:ATP-binding protein [Rhodococcus tukisamuensis]SDC89625.1 Signal transduction histidine kinase [Rhodococcus tukisamuensis]
MTRSEPRPANRLLNIGLRWKVAAVLAVPVTAAVVLGGLRVENEITTAANFSSAAEQVAEIPAIVEVGTALGTASAAVGTGTMTAQDIQAVKDGVAAARPAVGNPAISPAVSTDLDRALTTVEQLTEEIESRTTAPDLPQRTADVRAQLAGIIDEILAPIEDPDVISAHSRLTGSWSAQRRLADQVTGALTLLKDPNAPLTNLVTAAGAELAMIDLLAGQFPTVESQIDLLRDGVTYRVDAIEKAAGGPLPLLELRQSLIESRDVYGALIDESSRDIVSTVDQRAEAARTAALRDGILVLTALLATVVLGLLVAQSLVHPIRRLQQSALQVANHDLPDAIERIKVGDSSAVTDFEPIPVHTTEEIGTLARAVDDMHGQALKLAGEQAQLRLQIGDMFETLARRSKLLVDQQLGLIENLEFEEKDPTRLESLFRLDHLAARMRRNGDNLLILSGTRTRRGHSEPVQVGDVLRAAMSEVEDYQRVEVGNTPQGAIAGAVATDIVHLLAELLDNSLRASPPESRVTFNFDRAVDGGLLLEISDMGIGIPPAEMAAINQRLTVGGEVSAETARHMGLFVVSELATQHGLTVRMRPTFDTVRNQGVTTSVHIPRTVMVSPLSLAMTGPQSALETHDATAAQQWAPAPMRQMPEPIAPVSVTVGPGPITLSQDGAAPVPEPPQPVAGSSLPQRNPGAAAGFTERPTPAPIASLPRRTPGATPGLPQRPDTVAPAPVQSPVQTPVPAPAPAPEPVVAPAPAAGPPTDEPGVSRRHRYRLNSEKTASFFAARPRTEEPAGLLSTETTPIFMGMVSDWLTDPTDAEVGPAWKSAADVGWDAANRAAGPRGESRTASGLPQRQPGQRLVPGGVEGADQIDTPPRLRDPDAIREKLSRHQQGIREGRAAGQSERNSI